MNQNEFECLGIGEQFCRALNDVGYESPTPIQAQAIPHLLQGTDLLGVAQTGTGKTAAFALPVLQLLSAAKDRAKPRRPRALILAPTRELALQIHEEFTAFGRYVDLRHAVIFGGVGQNPQVKALARGLDVLVATPGRLLDLSSQGHLDLSEVRTLVLDMGFVRDVKRIVAQTPRSRQSLLFSATMPREVANLAREILKDPVRVDVAPKQVTVKKIEQRVVMVDNADKRGALEQLLRDPVVSRAIVFTRTKHGANKVAKQLVSVGIGAEAIHGNKSQNARQRALASFKAGDAWVLVATDIAARGIDIDGVSHVFNFELPHEPESYVHRIGRTGRAGAEGAAFSLVDPSERKRLKAVERLIGFPIVEATVTPITYARTVPVNPSAPGDRNRPRQKSGGGTAKAGSGSDSSGGRRRRRRRPQRAA